MAHAGFARKGCDRDNGLIHVLVVRPDMRQKGIGGQLSSACESFLSKASTITIGAMCVDVFTVTVNLPCVLFGVLLKESAWKLTTTRQGVSLGNGDTAP